MARELNENTGLGVDIDGDGKADFKISGRLSRSGFIQFLKLYLFSSLLKYLRLMVVKIKYRKAATQ